MEKLIGSSRPFQICSNIHIGVELRLCKRFYLRRKVTMWHGNRKIPWIIFNILNSNRFNRFDAGNLMDQRANQE